VHRSSWPSFNAEDRSPAVLDQKIESISEWRQGFTGPAGAFRLVDRAMSFLKCPGGRYGFLDGCIILDKTGWWGMRMDSFFFSFLNSDGANLVSLLDASLRKE